MESISVIGNPSLDRLKVIKTLFAALLLIGFAGLTILAQAQLTTSDDEKTVTVNDAPDMEVYAIGKSVIVKGRAKGVLAFGGDVVVEGRVDGDVATIGGSIIQKENAYIGGDIIAVGGEYRPEAKDPLREAGKETLMFAVLEKEFRDLGENPGQLLTPSFSPAFLALRLLSILFWFVVTFVITTLAPGGVSRAIARFRLSTLKVIGLGLTLFVVTSASTIISVKFLPNYISVILGLMVLFLMTMAYVFGRVALQVTFGKAIQRGLFGERSQSETIAILIGVLSWILIMSIPYVFIIGELALFATGLGLVLTARSKNVWRHE